jgi:hypothetical protein
VNASLRMRDSRQKLHVNQTKFFVRATSDHPNDFAVIPFLLRKVVFLS